MDDHIETTIIRTAMKIKENIASMERIFMYYTECDVQESCVRCNEMTRYSLVITDADSMQCSLCIDHTHYYQKIQSEILTESVISRRARLIGHHYTTLTERSYARYCVICYQCTPTYYTSKPRTTIICPSCKQRGIKQNIIIMLLLSEIISVADVRSYIMSLTH